MNNSDPLSTGPLSTGPLSTGPLSTGPLSTDPLIHCPLSTGPLSTGPLFPKIINKKGVINLSELRDYYKPRADQMQGSELEVLAEIAGRICYDSFGTGRSSVDWHKHVLEVEHLSVYEHCWFQVDDQYWLEGNEYDFLEYIGVPGIKLDNGKLYFNARFAIEHIGKGFCQIALFKLMPQVYQLLGCGDDLESDFGKECIDGTVIASNWSSLHIKCSRACSHELVRHGDNTAISQRSTRYVDESESGDSVPLNDRLKLTEKQWIEINLILIENFNYSKTMYRAIQSILGDTVPRKVANGLARLVLPNSLSTELIFSASDQQWGHMIKMRTHESADQEIRFLFNDIKSIL